MVKFYLFLICPVDSYVSAIFRRRRKDAIADLTVLGVHLDNVSSLLNTSIERGDMDEKLLAIEALGQDGSDKSIEILLNRLVLFNENQANNIEVNRNELTIVRQLLFGLERANNEKAVTPLMEMAFLGYTPELLREVDRFVASITES